MTRQDDSRAPSPARKGTAREGTLVEECKRAKTRSEMEAVLDVIVSSKDGVTRDGIAEKYEAETGNTISKKRLPVIIACLKRANLIDSWLADVMVSGRKVVTKFYGPPGSGRGRNDGRCQ